MYKIVAFSMLLFFASSVFPQDSHYWNIQYGTRSTLLGGAVIGSASDLSATYYNPGAISLFKDAKFILSARVYQLENITVKNGAGVGQDLSFSTVVPSPSFIAFDFKFDFLGDSRLALSILTRQKMDFELRNRLIDSLDIIDSSPGKEQFAGGINIQRELNEVWGGLTYSSKLSDVVGLGATWYIAYRGQRTLNQVIVQILPATGDIASLTSVNAYDFNNIRTLLKLGFGFNLSPLTLGLTVTTPSANITGSGSVGSHFFLNGIDTNGDGNNDNEFDSNFQDNVKSNFKSSWAVGAGAGYTAGKFKFHVSAEWYDAVKKYFVLDTKPFVSQSSGETLTNDLTNELKSVTNYGLGLEYFNSESLIFSGSFVTDFSAQIPESETNLTVSTWDIYHISGGITFKINKSDLTLGLEYAFGSKNIKQPIDITHPGAGGKSDLVEKSKVTTRRIKFLIGFIL